MMTADERAQLDENSRMTKQILEAVVGSPEFGHVGLVGQVKRAHERMDEHEKVDLLEFAAVRADTRKVGDKVTKVLYAFAGAMAVLKIGGAIWDAVHAIK